MSQNNLVKEENPTLIIGKLKDNLSFTDLEKNNSILTEVAEEIYGPLKKQERITSQDLLINYLRACVRHSSLFQDEVNNSGWGIFSEFKLPFPNAKTLEDQNTNYSAYFDLTFGHLIKENKKYKIIEDSDKPYGFIINFQEYYLEKDIEGCTQDIRDGETHRIKDTFKELVEILYPRVEIPCEFRITNQPIEKEGKITEINMVVDGCDIVGDSCQAHYDPCKTRENIINKMKEGKMLKSLIHVDYFDYSKTNHRADEYISLLEKLSGRTI
jgi:hypothetical protein